MEETKKKISISNKGKGLGKHHTFSNIEQFKEKQSKNKSIPIVQLDLEGNFIKEWSSSKQASKELGIQTSHLSKCINHLVKSAYGYKFIKKEEYE